MQVLRARNVRRRFGGREVLRGLDLDLEAGERAVLFGPNGAGKTTLLRVLAGLLRPSGGEVTWLGEGGAPLPPASIRRRVGYAGHRLLLYPHLTGRENLLFQAVLFEVPDRERRVRELLEMVGLAHRGDETLDGYSRGMAQRLSLARACLHDPEVLLLDEPHSGLDPQGAAALDDLLRRMREEGRAILMSSHDLRRGLQEADSVAVIRRGRLVLRRRAAELDAVEFESLYARLAAGGPAGGEA